MVVPPGATRLICSEAGSMARAKVPDTVASAETPVALLPGEMLDTVGAMVSAVVKVHALGLGMATPDVFCAVTEARYWV